MQHSHEKIILLVSLFLLTSCAQKWGVYTVMHEEKLPNGFSVRTIRYEDNVRCQVLRGKERVGELDVDDGHIKTVVFSYNKMNEGIDENMSITYNREHLVSVLISASKEKSVLVLDKDGDGLPDVKFEKSDGESIIQSIHYSFEDMTQKRDP